MPVSPRVTLVQRAPGVAYSCRRKVAPGARPWSEFRAIERMVGCATTTRCWAAAGWATSVAAMGIASIVAAATLRRVVFMRWYLLGLPWVHFRKYRVNTR